MVKIITTCPKTSYYYDRDHTSHCCVNDILEYRCPYNGVAFQWKVLGVYLGGNGTESYIEVLPINKK